MPGETEMGGPDVRFHETLWSTVLKARDRSSPSGNDAFGRLARAYWKPAYFFIRRRGRSVDEAKDLTQGFFAALLERDVLKGVDPAKGRFRTFLLTVLERFLANEHERAGALKRGGGREAVPLDVAQAEAELVRAGEGPEEAFERAWGAGVLARAFERLRGAPGFEALRIKLSENLSHGEIGKRLGCGAKDVENALYRARKKFKEAVLAEIRLEVESPAEAEEELARVLKMMGNQSVSR